MKRFFATMLLLGALFAARPAAAQFSIDKVDVDRSNVTFANPIRETDVSVEYFSPARYRAERAAIRKERNYLEISAGLEGALTSYNDPWVAVSGGDNSITLRARFYLKHTFTKNNFTVATQAEAYLGYNRMKVESDNGSEGIWFKNQDEFKIVVKPSMKISRDWSFGATVQFRSQFVNGYVSRTAQERGDRKSSFMSPAYLDVSPGITYACPDKRIPLQVTVSPFSLNATFVESDLVRRDNGYTYGIEDPDNTSKYEGGSSLRIEFDRTFGKTGFLRYRTTLDAFYGWISDIGQRNKIRDYQDYVAAYEEWVAAGSNIKEKPRLPIHPTVRWENTLSIKASRFLSTTLSFQLYYNRAQNTSLQTKTFLSVGLVYTFKNK